MNREQYVEFNAAMQRLWMNEFCLHPLVEGDGYSLLLDDTSTATLVHDVCGHPVSSSRVEGVLMPLVKVTVKFDQGECDRDVKENRSSEKPCCIAAEVEVKA